MRKLLFERLQNRIVVFFFSNFIVILTVFKGGDELLEVLYDKVIWKIAGPDWPDGRIGTV